MILDLCYSSFDRCSHQALINVLLFLKTIWPSLSCKLSGVSAFYVGIYRKKDFTKRSDEYKHTKTESMDVAKNSRKKYNPNLIQFVSMCV